MNKPTSLDNISRIFIYVEMENGVVYEVNAPLDQKKTALYMLTNENTDMIVYETIID